MNTTPDEQPDPAIAPDEATPTPEAAPGAANDAAPAEAVDLSLAGEAMNLISEHKGKLAIGVAATLGMMVYYGWREKRLAKTDPEEYARLQRLKASVRHSDAPPRSKAAKKTAPHVQAETSPAPGAGNDAPAGQDAAPELK